MAAGSRRPWQPPGPQAAAARRPMHPPPLQAPTPPGQSSAAGCGQPARPAPGSSGAPQPAQQTGSQRHAVGQPRRQRRLCGRNVLRAQCRQSAALGQLGGGVWEERWQRWPQRQAAVTGSSNIKSSPRRGGVRESLPHLAVRRPAVAAQACASRWTAAQPRRCQILLEEPYLDNAVIGTLALELGRGVE